EVICTLRGLEDFGAGFEGAHETRDGPFGDFAQKGFELGEGFSMGFLEINRFGNPPTDSTRSDTALIAYDLPMNRSVSPVKAKLKRFALHASLHSDRRWTAGGACVEMTPRCLAPVRSKSRESGRCRASSPT